MAMLNYQRLLKNDVSRLKTVLHFSDLQRPKKSGHMAFLYANLESPCNNCYLLL